MHDMDAERRSKAQKRALLAELLRKQSGSEAPAKPVFGPVPVIALSSVRNWRAEEQNSYVRYVTPYKGFLYQRLALDKTFVRGEGCYLFDADGARYADFIAQYGALPFGHDPAPIWRALESVRRESRPNLAIVSISPVAGELAERLLAIAPPGLAHVVFTNSGAEAVEAALKLARSRTGRFGILSASDGFHGLTLAGMSATDTEFFQRGFGAPAPGFSHVPFGDLEALEETLAAQPDFFAAFLVEPIQGESGIRVAPPGYLKGASELCRRFGTLLILDEVQTGLGRTGTLFACEAEGVTPDIITLAKALGGGLMPIGACLYSRHVYDEHFDLRHGSTFAGNTLACRAALATIEELTKDDQCLVRHVAAVGRRLQEQLRELQCEYPSLIVEVRGRGLMLALELDLDHVAKARSGVLAALQHHNLLLYMAVSFLLNVEHIRITTSFTHGNVLRIEPPLTADAALCDQLIDALRRLLDTLERGDAGQLLGHLMGRSLSRATRQFRLPKRHAPAWLAVAQRERRDDERTRFAFIAHPLGIADMGRLDPSLEAFTEGELEKFRARINGFVKPCPVDELAIRSADGRFTEGELIMLPYLPSEIVALPWNEAVDAVQSAVDLAAERGAQVIGLGGFSSIVADGGLALKTPAGVSMTSGNSFTTWAAVRAVEAACATRGRALANCTVAVVGAAGAIGHALSLLCAERMAELILVGNPRAGEASISKLRGIAEDCERHVTSLAARGRKFPAGSFAERSSRRKSSGNVAASELASRLTVTTDLDRHLPRAQIVFTATNAVLPFISSRHLSADAVVCDVSRPFNVAPELADERPDLRIVHGGLVQAPQTSLLGLLEEGAGRNVLVACAAETIIVALCRYRSRYLCGQLDIATIEEMGGLAQRMGFSVVS
jgi:acetylornithine/succinyldiaminopimelate/putrescine aminotransferase/predicted amino acid dehydrogenase